MAESFASNYLNFASTDELITRLLFIADHITRARIAYGRSTFIHSPVLDERDNLVYALSRRV